MIQTRVDEVFTLPDGRYEIRYTGVRNGVLPLTWGGTSEGPYTREQLAEVLRETEDNLTFSQVVMLQLAKEAKVDPTLRDTFRTRAAGKIAVVDLGGAGAAITL